MRLQIIIEPGDKYGPCERCQHEECGRLKTTAVTSCHLCGAFIGYNRAFCYDADERPVHFNCLAIEVKRQAQLLGIKHEDIITPVSPICYDKRTAAQLLCVGMSTLNAMIAKDEISRIKIGTRVSFTPQHLIEFLRRREQRSKHDDRPSFRIV